MKKPPALRPMCPIPLSGLACGLMLTAASVSAQEMLDLPDSLLFGAPVEVVHIATLADAGTVVAELPEVETLLIERRTDRYGSTYALAIASGTGHDLLPILGDDVVNDVQVSTSDVRGNGHLQVVVRTMSYAGHTGWEHAIHEREWTVSVWDLQERRCLLHLAHGYSHEEWTNSFAADSTGQLPYEERELLSSEGERHCVLYAASFAPGQLTLVRTDDCPGLEDRPHPATGTGEQVRYVLAAGGWVRQ